MDPKVHLWTTGSDATEGNSIEPITKMVQGFAPMLNGISDDIKLPNWFF
jgi:hypothetical protein